MSKRPRILPAPIKPYLTPTPDYWTSFLEAQNVIGHITREIEEGKPPAPTNQTLPSPEPVIITPDQWTFIFRVAEALVPVSGYPPDIKRKLLKTRETYRQSLEQVFRETIELNEWFTDTKQKTNLKEVELMEILYDALEGLRSEEARELREKFGVSVERLRAVRAGLLR